MLKHFAPALVVSALLVASSVVFAADPTPANPTQASPTAHADSTDATGPKVKKTKLHHIAKKKPTTISAKKKTVDPTQSGGAASPATKTN